MIDVNGYVAQIERAVDSPHRLEALREEIAGADALSDQDKQSLDARIGTYLADADRQSESAEGGFEPGNEPEEQG